MTKKKTIKNKKDFFSLLPKRKNDAHKGDCGRVVIIGGSSEMPGAVVLSAKAALRSGAGLVYVICPDCISNIVHNNSVESIVKGVPSDPIYGTFKEDSLKSSREIIEKADVLAIGPGMGQNKSIKMLIKTLLTNQQKYNNKNLKIIMDADAINLSDKDIIKKQKLSTHPIILTPHMGEMAGLIKSNIPYIQKHRIETAKKTSKELNSIIVLKGANTVVSNPVNEVYINNTGNPGMATAGSGDVLSGILAGIIGQNINIFDAVVLSVYLHGLAGDIAEKEKGILGLISSDIVESIPKAILSLNKKGI